MLLKEAVEILSPRDGLTYLDCTFGGGGHTRAILSSADCKVVAIDRDPCAARRAAEVKKEFGSRFEFANINFSNLDKLQTEGYAGILFNYGDTNYHLAKAARAFK